MGNARNSFSGVILAGGKSSRMGSPKPFIRVNGKRIIDIILDVFSSIFDKIFIVTDDKDKFSEFKDIKIVEDVVKDCGPLGGIYTGLKAIVNPKAFFVACDMPFLHNELIVRLLDVAKEDQADCVVPCSDRGLEPLHAVYSKATIASLENAIRRRDFSMANLLTQVNCKYVKAEKEESTSFININSPEDLRNIWKSIY
ncbi:molybdenum cofactor guanylyltransferase [Candidatus Omnitrophota bacterium]